MKFKIPVIMTAAGTLTGFFVLSPFAMYIAHFVHRKTPVYEMYISDIFGTEHFLWTLSFSLFGSAFGLVTGLLYYGLRKKTLGIKAAQDYARLVMNSMADGMLNIDRNFRVVCANEAFLKISGLSPEEVIGRHCYEVSHKTSAPCVSPHDTCPLIEVVETGTTVTTTHTHFDGEGKEMHVELTVSPVRNEVGDIVQIIEISRNITERKKLEEQLRHAQKMEAVGHLAGGIAHDFNNILTAIIGYGNILRMKIHRDDPLRTNVERILASSERAADLIRGLLTFGRKQILKPQSVSLNEIIGNMERLLVRHIGEDIEFKTILADEHFRTIADSSRLEQVLMNLAANARDAMPDGGALTIKTEGVYIDSEFIKAHGYGKSGGYVLLSLTDTGKGMDEETKEKIFEPFFTTKEAGKGAGLGLSIVYGIVKQHNGYIHVDSVLGEGATFKIYLPRVHSEIEETGAPKCVHRRKRDDTHAGR